MRPRNGVGAERGGQHTEILTRARQLARWGDVVEDQVEQRVQIIARAVEFGIRPAGAARGVEMREVELILVGIERGEKVEHLVERAVGLGVGLVDLVQDHDGTQAERQRLFA